MFVAVGTEQRHHARRGVGGKGDITRSRDREGGTKSVGTGHPRDRRILIDNFHGVGAGRIRRVDT